MIINSPEHKAAEAERRRLLDEEYFSKPSRIICSKKDIVLKDISHFTYSKYLIEIIPSYVLNSPIKVFQNQLNIGIGIDPDKFAFEFDVDHAFVWGYVSPFLAKIVIRSAIDPNYLREEYPDHCFCRELEVVDVSKNENQR